MEATCRLCLEVKKDCVQVKEDQWTARALQDIFGILIGLKDGLSKEVCDDCLGRTSAFYSFYLEVKTNQTKLVAIEPIKIKQEPEEVESPAPPVPIPVQTDGTSLVLNIPIMPALPTPEETANHILKLGPGIQIRVLEGQPMSVMDKNEPPDDRYQTDSDEDEELSMLEPNISIQEESSDRNLSSETQCHLCLKNFSKKYGLTRHMREVHDWGKQLKCHVCCQIFPTEVDLDFHLHAHRDVLDPMALQYCKICNKVFVSQAKLQSHNSTMHNELRPFGCTICHKKFKQFGHLQKHQSVHTRERPLKCSQCEATFKVSFNLRRHEKIHEMRKQKARESPGIIVVKEELEDEPLVKNEPMEDS